MVKKPRPHYTQLPFRDTGPYIYILIHYVWIEDENKWMQGKIFMTN